MGGELSIAGETLQPRWLHYTPLADMESSGKARHAAGPRGPAGRFGEAPAHMESSSEAAQGTSGAGRLRRAQASGGGTVSPKSSQPAGQPRDPKCPSSLPAKGLKAPQPPARREAGWGRRRRSSNEKDPNGNVNLAERRNICNPTCKDEIPVAWPAPAILQDRSSRAGAWGPSSRIPNHTHPGSPKAATATTPSPTVSQGLLPQNKNVHLATVPNPSQGKLCRNPGSG